MLAAPTPAGGGHPFWHLLLVAIACVAVFAGIKIWETWCAHAEDRRPERRAWSRPSSPLVIELALASFGSSATHFIAGPSHFHEAAAFGVFFLAAAGFQTAWSLAVVRRATRSLLMVGAAGNAGLLAVWFVTRTIGLPIGPRPWRPEAIGPLDMLASLLEVFVVGGCLWLVRHQDPRNPSGRRVGRVDHYGARFDTHQ
jgi:hypothetical protein